MSNDIHSLENEAFPIGELPRKTAGGPYTKHTKWLKCT